MVVVGEDPCHVKHLCPLISGTQQKIDFVITVSVFAEANICCYCIAVMIITSNCLFCSNLLIILFEDKPNSIAAAAATGFLKVPEVTEPVKSTTEQSAFQTGAGMSIADAAKSGFLKVPTVGETKGRMPWVMHSSTCKVVCITMHHLVCKLKCSVCLLRVFFHSIQNSRIPKPSRS